MRSQWTLVDGCSTPPNESHVHNLCQVLRQRESAELES